MPKNTTPQPEPETQPGPEDTTQSDQTPPGSSPSAGEQPPLTTPLAGNRFFAWMRSLNLTREPGWIGGVSAGIAARLGVDPLIVRGIIVVVAVLGGPALLLYAAAWLLLPDEHDKIHLEEVFKGRLDSPIAGIGALILLSMLPVTQGFWFAGSAFWGEPFWAQSFGRALWTVVLLGLIVWFVIWVARRSGRASNAPTATPATTDARPDTIPQPPAAPNETTVAAIAPPGARPAAPSGTASAEEFAAWRQQQAQWKAENDAFRARQASEQRAASMAAQAQYRAEQAARRAVYNAHYARTRSNPLYSFIAIGLALVVGGTVTVLQGDGAIEPAGVLAGLGATLAVLAVAIIVNGARGHRPGGAQGVAAIVLVPLLVAAILPHNPDISYTDDATYVPRSENGASSDAYFTGVGDTVLDLRDYYDTPLPDGYEGDLYGHITVVSGVGDVTVLVPDDAALSYSANIGSGRLDSPDGDARGSWVNEYGQFNLLEQGEDDNVDERAVSLVVTMGTGTLRFEQIPATEGASE